MNQASLSAEPSTITEIRRQLNFFSEIPLFKACLKQSNCLKRHFSLN